MKNGGRDGVREGRKREESVQCDGGLTYLPFNVFGRCALTDDDDDIPPLGAKYAALSLPHSAAETPAPPLKKKEEFLVAQRKSS